MDIILRRCTRYHKKTIKQMYLPAILQRLTSVNPQPVTAHKKTFKSYTCGHYKSANTNRNFVSQKVVQSSSAGSVWKYNVGVLDNYYMVISRTYAKKSKDKGGKKGHSKPKVELSVEQLNEIIDFNKYKNELDKILVKLQQDYVDQLALRSSIGALDNLVVDTSDGKFPLLQLAKITQKNPMLYVVDLTTSPQYIKQVKSAIQASAMNLNPQQEKTTLFVPIPKVTREHRENMAKKAKTLCDKTKDKLRHIHTDYTKKIARKQKAEIFSADLVKNVKDTIQFTLNEHTGKAEEVMKFKQKELLGN